MFTLDELRDAAAFVHARMPPTPQYAWPLLAGAIGAEVWVKHENHTPKGAFKVRGAFTFIDRLTRTHPDSPGICTATRGNHGQGQAWAAKQAGLTAKVYVPHGNSVEKNAAMRAYGAELIEFGHDFDTAREEAFRVAREEGLFIVPPFHRELVRGVATYGYEFLSAQPDLDTVYVPIGCGSGICGVEPPLPRCNSARYRNKFNRHDVTVLQQRSLGQSDSTQGVRELACPCRNLA